MSAPLRGNAALDPQCLLEVRHWHAELGRDRIERLSRAEEAEYVLDPRAAGSEDRLTETPIWVDDDVLGGISRKANTYCIVVRAVVDPAQIRVDDLIEDVLVVPSHDQLARLLAIVGV